MIYEVNEESPYMIDNVIEPVQRRSARLANVRENILTFDSDESELEISIPVANNKKHIMGLDNFGNTCYLNTILQTFRYLKRFTTLLNDETISRLVFEKLTRSMSYQEGILQFDNTVLRNFRKLFQSMNINNKKLKSIKPLSIRTALRQKNEMFDNDFQQDVHEAFTSITEIIHQELSQKIDIPQPTTDLEIACKTHWSNDYSPIYELFHGMYCETRTCSLCKHNNSNYAPNLCLCLDIPKFESEKYPTDYSKYIMIKSKISNVKLLDLEINNMIQCLTPETKRNIEFIDRNIREKTQSYTINECMELYSKDSIIEDVQCSFCDQKCNAICKYTMCIAPKILVIQLKRFSYNGSKICNPIELELTHNIIVDDIIYHYKLSALINHNGHDISCGHYYSYAYSEDNNSWYMFNDSKTIKTAPANINTSETYMLFYELIDENT